MKNLVVAITGASGATYAARLLDVLERDGSFRIHLTISATAAEIIKRELGTSVDLVNFDLSSLIGRSSDSVVYYHHSNLGAPIASGSFLTDGMIIVPCSMGTMGAVASGIASNLIRRTADVMLKERRRLVLVTRETPLSAIHLENMLKLSRAGACILPASPAFYHGVESVSDLTDFVVSRALDQLGVQNELVRRWQDQCPLWDE